MNPSVFPERTKHNYQETKPHRIRQGKPNEPHLPEGKCIADLPVSERLKWIDPHQDPNHPHMTQTDFTCKCEERVKATEKKKQDQEKKIEDQQITIQDQQVKIDLLLKHLSDLTVQVNELTKQMKK